MSTSATRRTRLSTPKRPGTEPISFRLFSSDLGQLREMAGSKRISINSLVSQILENYLNMYAFDRQFGFFSVSKRLIQMTFVNLSDKQIEEIGKEIGAKDNREIIRYLFGKLDKYSLLRFLDIYGTRFESYRHFVDGTRHTLAISHDINLQFSKVYYDIIKATLALAGIQPNDGEKDLTDRGFSISFDLLTS